MAGKPRCSRGSASTSVPSARRGTRLAGGSVPAETHSSSATSSARSTGSASSVLRGCWQMPLPRCRLPPLWGKLEKRLQAHVRRVGQVVAQRVGVQQRRCLHQYSFDEFASRILGQVPLSRQRRRRPSVRPVTASRTTL